MQQPNLSGKSFRQKELQGADFKNAVLHNTDFLSADLTGADLSGADLYNANMGSATLVGANLTYASLIKANLVNLKREEWNKKASKREQMNPGANLTTARLDFAIMTGAILRGVNFEGSSMKHVNLNGADLKNANLKGVLLDHANLVNADLTGANLDGVNLKLVNLAGAIIDERYMKDEWSPAKTINADRDSLRKANLRGANLIEHDLSGIDLSGADLRGANLRGAKMRGTNLTNANLTGAYLGNTDLTDATLVGTILDGANLSNIIFDNVHVSNISYVKIYSEDVYLPFYLPFKSIHSKGQLAERSLNSICSNATFRLNDDFSIRHLTFAEKGKLMQMYYKGKPARYTVGEPIAEGGYGIVNKLTIVTHEGEHTCAIKTSLGEDILDELAVLERFPKALSCEGILDIIADPKGQIIMPLANGDISDYKGATLKQALEIVGIIGRQLLCLHRHGVRYYDIKPVNILYFCRKNGHVDISLADIGSINPIKRGNRNYFPASIPPPGMKHGPIPEDLPRFESYYTFLLINLAYMLTAGRGRMLPWYFPVDVISPDEQNITTMPHYITELHSTIVKFYEFISVDIADERSHVFLNIISALGRQLETLKHKVENVAEYSQLNLELPPLNVFLETLRG